MMNREFYQALEQRYMQHQYNTGVGELVEQEQRDASPLERVSVGTHGELSPLDHRRNGNMMTPLTACRDISPFSVGTMGTEAVSNGMTPLDGRIENIAHMGMHGVSTTTSGLNSINDLRNGNGMSSQECFKFTSNNYEGLPSQPLPPIALVSSQHRHNQLNMPDFMHPNLSCLSAPNSYGGMRGNEGGCFSTLSVPMSSEMDTRGHLAYESSRLQQQQQQQHHNHHQQQQQHSHEDDDSYSYQLYPSSSEGGHFHPPDSKMVFYDTSMSDTKPALSLYKPQIGCDLMSNIDGSGAAKAEMSPIGYDHRRSLQQLSQYGGDHKLVQFPHSMPYEMPHLSTAAMNIHHHQQQQIQQQYAMIAGERMSRDELQTPSSRRAGTESPHGTIEPSRFV